MKRLCHNQNNAADVILNNVKNLDRSIGYKGKILRLRLRMTYDMVSTRGKIRRGTGRKDMDVNCVRRRTE
jgi:hypothetical protein